MIFNFVIFAKSGERVAKMTFSKYKRLCLVLLLPLLAAGFICAHAAWPYDPYQNVLCQPFLGSENCRPVGHIDGPLYKSIKKDTDKDWFEIWTYDEHSPTSTYAMASGRFIGGAEITGALPFSGEGHEVADFMKRNLVGKQAMVHLGFPTETAKSRAINATTVLLYCNDLRYQAEPGTYTSGCYGEGWSGPVTYRIDSRPSRSMLDTLQSDVWRLVDEKNSDFRLWQIVIYPIFIYGFLLLSFVGWMTVKATRFVKTS